MRTRIHLVRHAISEANLDKSANLRKPDHAIELAPEGIEQAAEAGRALARHIIGEGEGSVGGFHHRRVRLYVSPYLRTRQTADGIAKGLTGQSIEFDRKEYRQLREISFGLYDGLTDEELAAHYPREHEHYAKHVRFEGEFFAPMPMGESRVQVADRVRSTFGSILRDMSGQHQPPVTDAIVVSHGVTIRAFRLEWFNRPWEWYEAEKNPNNCSITTIEGAQGQGWRESLTYPGFAHVRGGEQEKREEGRVD